MRTRGIFSLVPNVLLCLPSLGGGVALLGNVVLQQRIEKWGVVSSCLVALAVYLGGPLVTAAMVVSGLAGLSGRVSPRVKYAHYIIVSLATVATVSVTFHFGM